MSVHDVNEAVLPTEIDLSISSLLALKPALLAVFDNAGSVHVPHAERA